MQDLAADLDAIAARQAEIEQELKSAETRPNRIERIVDHLVSVKSLIKRMEELKGSPELRELRQRLKTELQQIFDKIEIEAGQQESKIVMRYRNDFTLYLTVDRQGNPTLYHFDGDGVDVDPDYSDSVAAERAERQRRVNRLVAKALWRQGFNPHMQG